MGSISGAPAPAGRIWKSMCGPSVWAPAAGVALRRSLPRRRGRARSRRSPARPGAARAGRRRWRRSGTTRAPPARTTRGAAGAGACRGRAPAPMAAGGSSAAAAPSARPDAAASRGQRRARLHARGRGAAGAGSAPAPDWVIRALTAASHAAPAPDRARIRCPAGRRCRCCRRRRAARCSDPATANRRCARLPVLHRDHGRARLRVDDRARERLGGAELTAGRSGSRRLKCEAACTGKRASVRPVIAPSSSRRRAAEQLRAQQHRFDVGLGVVVGEDRRADVRGAAGGAQVACGGEDRVGRVVGVLEAVAVGVHAVLRPRTRAGTASTPRRRRWRR